jgi:hypothetical protein
VLKVYDMSTYGERKDRLTVCQDNKIIVNLSFLSPCVDMSYTFNTLSYYPDKQSICPFSKYNVFRDVM